VSGRKVVTGVEIGSALIVHTATLPAVRYVRSVRDQEIAIWSYRRMATRVEIGEAIRSDERMATEV